MSTNGNDMAFPVLDRSQTPNETYQLGLTKREQFAAMALQGMLANTSADGHLAEYTRRAVLSADYLIAALSATPDAADPLEPR